MINKDTPLPELPGINIQRAAKMLGDNHSLLLRLLQKFPANHGQTVLKILDALDGGDQNSAYRLAHSLKSVAGTLGAEQLFQYTDNVLGDLKNNRDISEHLTEMETELQRVVQSIKILR